MSLLQRAVPRHLSSILVLAVLLLRQTVADVGTAGHYDPPYTPSACFGYNPLEFSSSFLIAVAGKGIWDNGACCGRQYWVCCISADRPKTCNPARLIQVRIVDRALSSVSRSSSNHATLVLSKIGFGAIANPSASSINV
ncbi:uncharacterized protein J3R85_001439 [Psidium guajava]|nr:uncharacterized protein J3R85_001439 [Psidium guajava]